MSTPTPTPAPHDAARFTAPAAVPRPRPLLRFSLAPADRPLVAPGQHVEPGQPIIEHFREQEAVEIPTTAAIVGLRPGDFFDHAPQAGGGRSARKAPATSYRTRICEHGRDGITRLAAGSGAIIIHSPAAGVVERVVPGRVDIRAEGLAVDAQVGWGRAAVGHVVIASDGPSGEVRASRIDVSAAGAILVAGARLDTEAMSRARAIGVAAVLTGGVASRSLRQLGSSEARQQAALHASAPFGLLALTGYGRLPVPRHIWDLLVAAEGRTAGIHPASRTLIIGGDPRPLLEAAARPLGTVRITTGEHRDREGRLVGLAGPRRWPGGTYAPGGFVESLAADGRSERICVPLWSLERLG
jgi:hypothetical protein